MGAMTRSAGGVLSSYRAHDGAYDEVLAPDGRVREHWRALVSALDELGPDELERRRREVGRLLRNDGVTYHVYGEPDGLHATWGLDPIPLLLGSDEWTDIEQGVIERAEVLNLVLADLYGPRELIRRGLIPGEVVFGHRGFLRPCDALPTPVAPLFSYAADLARGPDGQMWVIADLAQTPSGAGYALENRVVISRVFPSLYRDAQVHRLAPFFRTLRSALIDSAPKGVDDPRVVVLTPGPLNETYFEHAYLATTLGYSLVEGTDLVVRDGYLWLRSLGGLERVDVVLRRVDGWYCDPLELKPDSQLGVPGLVEACRRGNVSVVNPMGSSVLENPGLLPFLSGIAEHFLGRALTLPSAATWWCGHDTARQYVLDHLPELIVKPIGRRQGRNAVFGWELSRDELDVLRDRIRAKPNYFVGQESVSFSSAPSFTADGLDSRQTLLRTFAVARDESYVVLPGGLTRVAPAPGGKPLSNQAGALSKDTWVLSSEPELQTSFWLHRGPIEASDPAASLPSRAAENLFWLGRYAERAEDTVRLLRTVLDRRTDFQIGSNVAGTEVLQGLLAALTDLTATYPGFVGAGAAERLANPESELLGTILDAGRLGTLAFSLRAMLDTANAVRDQLSGDTWLVLGNLERELLPLSGPVPDLQAAVQAALAGVMRSLLAFAGLATESMVRDPGWSFMEVGRRVERGILLSTLLRSTLVPARDTAAESLMLESVLVAGESIITYRRRYRSHAQLETLLDLMLLDADNPRSLAFQLARLEQEDSILPRPRAGRLTDEERLALELSTHVRVTDTAELAKPDQHGRRVALETFLLDITDRLHALADTIDAAHFTHPQPSQMLVASQPELTGESLGWVMP